MSSSNHFKRGVEELQIQSASGLQLETMLELDKRNGDSGGSSAVSEHNNQNALLKMRSVRNESPSA